MQQKLNMPAGRIARASMFFVLAVHGLNAWADEFDTLNFSAGLTRQHDSNLFRLSDGVDPRLMVGKSVRADDITTATLGVSLKKRYSLQQFEAGLEHVSSRYANYDFLNSDADNVRAAWRWHLTPRLAGNLTYDRSQALVGFGDYTNIGAKNMRTNTVSRFDADWLMMGGWYLRGGIGETRSINSEVFIQDEGTRLASADVGIRYVFPSANWIELISRGGQGRLYRRLDPVNQLDDAYTEQRDEARLYWRTSGKSLLEGSLGRQRRSYGHYRIRDYDDSVGSLKWTWSPTGKLGLELSWKSDLTAYTDRNTSYYRQNIYSVAPVWQISPKVKLSLKLDRNEREYHGPVVPTPLAARNDQIDTTQLYAEWTPERNISINGFLTRDRRASNLPGLGYSALVAGAGLRLTF